MLAKRNPRALDYAIMNMVLYLHLYPFSRYVIAELDARIRAIDTGEYVEPPAMPANTQGACGSVVKLKAVARVLC